MKLKKFNEHLSFPKLEQEIRNICREFYIKNYSINEDGSVDVNGDVEIEEWEIEKLPLRFRNITGGFWINDNKLKSLKGCPKTVDEDFSCAGNFLVSLVGGPESVGGDFYCNDGKLRSLEGSPRRIGGDFHCDNNRIVDFKGVPELIRYGFDCNHNPVNEIYQLNPCKDFIELLNEYDVIRDGSKVVETRLRQALEDSRCENISEEFEFINYKLI